MSDGIDVDRYARDFASLRFFEPEPKHALNNWLRLAGPSFDTSLALECLGFRLNDVREGMSAARAKRPADFNR